MVTTSWRVEILNKIEWLQFFDKTLEIQLQKQCFFRSKNCQFLLDSFVWRDLLAFMISSKRLIVRDMLFQDHKKLKIAIIFIF